MGILVQENAGHLAAWLPPVLAALGAAAIAVLLCVWGRRRPARTVSRSLAALAWIARRVILPGSAIGLIVAFGPMAPLFTSSARLEGRIGEVVPDTRFWRVTDGGAQNLSDLRGKVVLVNLWATWCPPCRAELPTLNRLQEDHRKNGLVVLTLSDEQPARVAPFVTKLAPGALNGYVESFGWLDIRKFRPFSLIIDRDGVLRDFVFGAQDYSVFDRKVRAYLD